LLLIIYLVEALGFSCFVVVGMRLIFKTLGAYALRAARFEGGGASAKWCRPKIALCSRRPG